METINKSSISRYSYYFIHYGKRSNLSHRPFDQYNGRISKPSMDNAALRVYQHSFHKKLSNMVISFHAVEQPVESLPVHRDDDSISSGSEATVKEVKEGTKVAESTEFIVGEYVKLNESDSPNLLKLFSGASIVPKHHLNALLLELFKIFGNKSSVSVDFQYKNGNRGCAIIVPRVKHQDSFKKQAKKLQWIESLLDHVAGSDQHDENDAAKWMSYYIGKKYDGPFTLALEALG
jgi:transcription antitermination factor NusG